MFRQDLIQRKMQMTAYERKTVHDIFLSTIEWFEKYIELTYKGEFPNWESRKQIRDNLIITRKDIYENPKRAEEALASQLHLFSSVLEEDTSVEFEKDLKQEFYKWINVVGIDIENCPERLRHFIFGLNEIFEGNYEKIRNDIANRKREIELDDPKYMDGMMKIFSHTQVSMHKEGKIKKSMEGKNPDEIKFSNFSGGDGEQGQQVFEQIAGSISDSHQDFYFKDQKTQQLTGLKLAATYNDEMLEFKYKEACEKLRTGKNWDRIDSEQGLKEWSYQLETERIKRSVNDWSVKNVVTLVGGQYGDVYRNEERKLALVHNSVDLTNLNNYFLGRQLIVDNRRDLFLEGTYPFEKLARSQVEKSRQQGRNLQHYNQRLEVIYQSDNNNNQFPKTPLIIGSVGFGLLLTRIMIHKLKKIRLKNNFSAYAKKLNNAQGKYL